MDQIKIMTLGLALAAAFGFSNDVQAQTSGATFGTTRPIASQTAAPAASNAVFQAPQFGPTPVTITQPAAEPQTAPVQGPVLAIFSAPQNAESPIASVSYEDAPEYEPVVLLETNDAAPQTTFAPVAPVAQDVANDASQMAPSPTPSERPEPKYVLSDPFARPRPARQQKGPKGDSAMTKVLEKGAEDGVFTRNGKHVYSFEPPTTLSALKSKPTPNVQSASQNVLSAVYPTQTQVSRYPGATPQAPGAKPVVPQVNTQPLPTSSAASQPANPHWTTSYPAPQPVPSQPAARPQIDYALNYSQPSPQTPDAYANADAQTTQAPAKESPQIVGEYAPMPAQGAYARFTGEPTCAQPSAAYSYADYASDPYAAPFCMSSCSPNCSTGFFGAGEWLSWRTERSNNAFAQVGNDEQTLSPSGAGFRAAAGFRGVRGWDVSWTYTYFDADKSQNVSGADVYGSGPFARSLADSANGNADVNLQIHDFEIGRWNANCNSSLAFRPFLGFRWTHLDESLDRQYARTAVNHAERVVGDYYSRSKLEAYGLRFGAEARVPLFGALAGFAKGAGTIAVGDVKSSYLATVDGETLAAFSAKKTYFTPSIEAALGLSWKRGGFEARGGYEFSDWFNASNVSGVNDDFVAHGWFAGVSWNR